MRRSMILKVHFYIIHNEERVLRVEELISGSKQWPKRFRTKLRASNYHRARTIYGVTDKEVAEKAARYLESSSSASR